MSLLTASAVAEAAAEQSGGVPGVVFGLFAFGVLVVALVVTLMVNVDH